MLKDYQDNADQVVTTPRVATEAAKGSPKLCHKSAIGSMYELLIAIVDWAPLWAKRLTRREPSDNWISNWGLQLV